MWTKVSDGLPPEDTVVQVYGPLCVCVGIYSDGKWLYPTNDWDEEDWEEWDFYLPTHWTPLQPPPTAEETGSEAERPLTSAMVPCDKELQDLKVWDVAAKWRFRFCPYCGRRTAP